MPSIRKEMSLAANADEVWEAFRDVGAVHRLAPGFVTDCQMEGDSRMVTFANGIVARELIVDVDDAARRLAYAVIGGRLTHHNASFQIIPEGAERCRVVWQADLMPVELKPAIEAMMDQGMLAMHRNLQTLAA